jgi:Putative zinc-finger
MNCPTIEQRLSAYIDGELSSNEKMQVEDHCDQCQTCSEMISQFVAMGTLMRCSEKPVDTAAIWQNIATGLVDGPRIPNSANTRTWLYVLLGTAVSMAFLWITIRFNQSPEHDKHASAHQHDTLAVDFQQILATAATEPKAALEILTTKYQGREMDQSAATQFLGYEPVLFRSIPAGIARISTHVLNMPCCKCSATICERNDGSSLILFEHKEEQPIWFGETLPMQAQCSGKKCLIVESAGQLAISWKSDDRQLTLIGVKDIAEVSPWVDSLKL